MAKRSVGVQPLSSASERSIDSHPLALADSPRASSSTKHEADDLTAPPTNKARQATLRGYPEASSSQTRPGYFDLQRLAAAHAEAANVERDRSTSISFPGYQSTHSSSTSSSRASEDGMDGTEDGNESEEDEIPRWLKSANSTVSSRRPASRNSLFSSMQGQASRVGHRESMSSNLVRTNGISSRNSMRSPPPSVSMFNASTGSHLVGTPLLQPAGMEGKEADTAEGADDIAKPSQQLLTSLHLMTDDELDRQLGVVGPSTAALGPNVPPLQSQMHSASGRSGSTASRSASTSHLTASPPPHSPNAARSSPSFAQPEAKPHSMGDSKARHSLVRALSERLGAALHDLQLSRRAFEQERERLAGMANGKRKESAAREQALRDILTTMGVSTSRVDRALMQATAQAHVPVFKADERLADYLSPGLGAGAEAKRDSNEELLPESLREAMSEEVNETTAEMASIAVESLQRPVAKRATAQAIEGEGSRTPIRSMSPPSGSSSKLDRTATMTTPKERAAWGSGLVPWVGTGGGSKKAAASIQATSPAAVEADGYFSDGPGKTVHAETPSPTPKQRHSRSTSISAIMAQVQDESDEEQEQERAGWADTASRGALGILGSLAWRRKKPDRSKTVRGKVQKRPPIGHASPEERGGMGESVAGDVDSVSVYSNRTGQSSTSGQRESEEVEDRNDDTVRAKVPHLRPQAQYTMSGRDVITALYEAIGSPPVSPELERRQMVSSPTAALPKPDHFKAIFLATRIMTTDPASVLLDSGRKTSLRIRQMAMALVEGAREEGKMVSEASSAKTNKRLSTLAPIPPPPPTEERDARASAPTSVPASGSSSTTATLSRALGRYKKPSVEKMTEPNVTRLPQLFGFGVQSAATSTSAEEREKSSTNGATTSGGEKAAESAAPMVTELEPILAHDVKPPTLALSVRRSPIMPRPIRRRQRQDTLDSLDRVSEGEESSGDEFEVYGGKNLVSTPSSAQSSGKAGGGDEALLTDRYGFVYDATPADVRLLRRARREATHAPACLTGIRVGVRARGGTDSQSDEDKDEGEGTDSDVEQACVDATRSSSPVDSDAASQRTVSSHKTGGTSGALGTTSSSVGGLFPVKPSKAVAEASTLSAASLTSSSPGPTCPIQERLHFQGRKGDPPSLPSIATAQRPPSTSQTVKRLLGQLQEMHQGQQAAQQTEWDNFLRRRRAGAGTATREKGEAGPASSTGQGRASSGLVDVVVRKGGDALGIKTKTAGTAFAKMDSTSLLSEEEWHLGGLVGLSRMGTESKDYQDFVRLIQKGVPLVYRPKIWYECSGAMELNEPGKYQELLQDHEDEENMCTNQIDLDIGRTMPTNIYFAGDGPGVVKLRRLLVAFSWYNPKCGYCQGMNNLAATLLLTHATEEEAFWVLVSIIEKILPEEYYTSHLLVSQADQRVLMDLMDEVLPQLSNHIRDLGVDLPAVTFAWFLSLYTDCLPVETLFRVWDLMFVEGMIVLFRIAIAIFIINEKELLHTSSPSAFYSFVHSMTSHLFAVDRLVKLACEDLKGSVRKEMIVERREKHVRDLMAELGLDGAAS